MSSETHVNVRISAATLEKIVCSFIPKELLPKKVSFRGDNGTENLQDLLNNSNGKLGIFGSAEKFSQSLVSFARFPGSFKYFNVNLAEVFYIRPPLYRSLKGDTHLYKADVCTWFEACIKNPLPQSDAILVQRTISFYLKSLQCKLSSNSEMVQISEYELTALHTRMSTLIESFSKLYFKSETSSENEMFKKWIEAMEIKETDKPEEEVLNIWKDHSKKVPFKNNEERYERMILWINMMIELFDRFIKTNSIDILPMPETTQPVKKPIVRLFSDNKKHFVMVYELLQTMKNAQMDVSSLEKEVLGMPKLATFSFKEVSQKVNKEDMKIIEFVRVPVITTEFAATPIPTIDGGYCVLATDGFFELISKNSDLPDTISAERYDANDSLNLENEKKDSGIDSKTALETNENNSDSSENHPASNEEPSKNFSVGMKKKTKKVKKQKSSVNNSESVDVKPEEKESNSCPKCYRASEFHKEQLRQSNIESRDLKKKLLEVRKENEEKDEKIRLLKEKLLTQEQKSLKEKEENEKRIQVLEQLLQAQEQNLTEQIKTIKNLKESVNVPSTSSNPTQEVPAQRSQEESQKVRVVLYNLLDIEDIIHNQNPISKASEITNRLIMKAEREDAELRAEARKEFRSFSHKYNIYVKSVEKNLELIRNNQSITVEEIPALPEFPSFSEDFLKAYKDTMKSDAPIICEALLIPAEIQEANPNELDDKECVICLIKIQPANETLKCEACKRRFHNKCVSQWLDVKRECPTCRATLLDPNEFPALQ